MAIVILAVLGAAGISIYVSTIDWNKHKGKLSEQLMEITGKKVVFTGPVSLSLFPTPYLTAKNVRVYSAVNQDLDHPLMKIESLVAKLSFSALLGGSFDVKMMSLVKPDIFLQKSDKGINWMDNAKTNANAKIKNVNIALDSVLLSDARMVIVDEEHDVNISLENLKAEIIADSLNGPYRIDGSYTKGNNPEGFAISIGNLSDSFATNLNFVLSQPASETYLRFDGTFLLSNEAVNGNLILESQKFKEFYDSMVPNGNLGTYWDQKLETSMELKVNKTQIELSNVILKHGASAGAGNVVIPLHGENYVIGDTDQDEEKRNIAVKFEMTDWKLEPVVLWLKDFAQAQQSSDAVYAPSYPFDMDLSLSALKADYNGQVIKDLGLHFILSDNVWRLDGVDGVFPGNTQLKASGRMFSVEDVLSYTASLEVQTENLKKLLEWIHIPVKQVAASTYLKSSLKAELVGDTKAIRISPFELNVDNTALQGHFGFKLGQPPHYALELTGDSINLDNYLPPVAGDKGKSVAVAIADLWKNMTWANEVDLDLRLNAGLLIYESMPFDKVVFNASLQKGVLNVEKFSINEFLKSQVNLSGEVKGFGDRLQLSNMNYNLSAEDFTPWLQRLQITLPKFNLKYFQPFSSAGVVSMNTNRIWLKADSKNGNLESSYSGRITETAGSYVLNGELQLKAPDALEFLRSLPVDYVPRDNSFGRLTLKANVVGNTDKFKLSDMQFSVGANTFQGTLGADTARDIPYWAANLKINRLEPERFMPKNGGSPRFSVDKAANRVGDLWNKPTLSDTVFGYEALRRINWNAKFEINELLLKGQLLRNVHGGLENKNNELTLSSFRAAYNDGELNASLKYQLNDKPRLSGDVSVTNQNVFDLGWSGNIYGIKTGTAEISASVDTSAVSPRDILDNFSGVVSVNINNPVVKGIDLASISEDLQQRTQNDGLQAVLLDNLQQGETAFNKFSGRAAFKDGSWMLENAQFSSDAATVDVSGTGNLGSWRMDELFTVQLAEPENINPFDFRLKGEMSAPELSVDSSLISKVYNDRQAKIEADKKAEQEAYERDLQSRTEVQKAVLQGVREAFDNLVNDRYLPLSDKLYFDAHKAELERLGETLETQKQAFADVDVLLQEKEIKEDYPLRLAKISEAAEALINETEEAMTSLYLVDLKDKIAENYAALQQETADRDKTMKECLEERDRQLQRLAAVDTNYRFETDKMYRQLGESIDEQIQVFDDAVKNVSRFGNISALETDIGELEAYAQSSAEMLEQAKKQREIITDNVDRYLTYIDEKIKLEEKAAADRREAEEQAKKVEENIGIISTPGTGKVQTIIRGIDEIEEGENSLPDPDSIGEIKAEDLEIDLLRRDEQPVNASGVILKK